MSDNYMETEPGGESTQYESIKTVTQPKNKQTGQLGHSEESDADSNERVTDDRGERTAENIRYGQKISEEGMGGTTTDNTGEANIDSGYGGSKAQTGDEGATRAAQGYGGKQDEDNNVGG